jgi:sugar (pentulose or hexulose) kinase
VRVPTNVETTATGAAILAAAGCGERPDVAYAIDAFVSYEPAEHEPDPKRRERYLEAYARYRDVYYALKPLAPRMAAAGIA